MPKPSLFLLGAQGRMGKAVSEVYLEHAVDFNFELCWGDVQGTDFFNAEIVLDFASPQAVIPLLAPTPQKIWVIGSTPWGDLEKKSLQTFAESGVCLLAPNFSLGMGIFQWILEQSAGLLKQADFKPILLEAHHRHKKDRPSGSAKKLEEILKPFWNQAIETHSLRAGEEKGAHELRFYGFHELFSITHTVSDRKVFALGALKVCQWLMDKKKREPDLKGLLSFQHYIQDFLMRA